jgi:hypothetical protein
VSTLDKDRFSDVSKTCFSPNGKRLISLVWMSGYFMVELWDVITGDRLLLGCRNLWNTPVFHLMLMGPAAKFDNDKTQRWRLSFSTPLHKCFIDHDIFMTNYSLPWFIPHKVRGLWTSRGDG